MSEVSVISEGQLPDVTPAALKGCWRRNWIEINHGIRDASTRVWWVQNEFFYADLRIPIDRPSFEGVDGLRNCSPEQRRWLAMQQGFAGRLGKLGLVFHWQREIDFQPPSGTRDVGHLQFVNDKCSIMLEAGLEEPYVEEWERIGDEANPLVFKLKREHADERGLLVAAGEHFLMVVDRHRKLPPAKSLLELVQMSSDAEQVELLDMEISHGRRVGKPGDWIISESTFPWREGKRAFETFPFDRWS